MQDRRRLPAPLIAALLLSAGVHAAMVVVGGMRPPVALSIAASGANGAGASSVLHLHVRPPAAREPVPNPAVAIVAPPRAATTTPIGVSRMHPPAVEDPIGETNEPTVRPVPLTYPVIALPADDDPHRVGLVRLMLVVSSEGKVARTLVIASTLSQDYVDRIQRSFEDMRFTPAFARGLPQAGWYEVVVNFDFDPSVRSSL